MGHLIQKTFETILPGNFAFNGDELLPVRVRDIILDKSHPEIVSNKFTGTDGIGVIKYIPIDQSKEETNTQNLPFAFPLNSFNNTLPLKNEIVLLLKAPRAEETIKQIDYYISIVGLFNDVNYIPSTSEDLKENENPGYNFKANNKIRPIHPFNGDTIIQGRLGSAIRFTGAKSPKNTFSVDSNANQPLIILSNGHQEINENELYVEDINKDKSSLYICSNHTVPLKQSRDKYAGAKKRPVKADQYKGNQIILNSGRFFFNSSEEDIQFAAQKSFGVTAEQLFLDGKEYIGLDAKKIYLGESARVSESNPVVLGRQLELFLTTLLDSVKIIGEAMKVAKDGSFKPILNLNLEGPSVIELVNDLQKNIKQGLLTSEKVFTE